MILDIKNQNIETNSERNNDSEKPPKKKKKSNRCKCCKKKKGAYLLECKLCKKKFCISCLDVDKHCCKYKNKYLQQKKDELKKELKSADSNFLKIDKI